MAALANHDPLIKPAASKTTRLMRSWMHMEGCFTWYQVSSLADKHLQGMKTSEALSRDPKVSAQTNPRSLWAKNSSNLGTLSNTRVKVGPSGIKTSAGAPMLGLFATAAIRKGEWVTAYGGVLEWLIERRAQSRNTHAIRIPDSSCIWNGRPWALLFSVCSTTDGLHHLITRYSAINMIMQLEHETWHVGEAATVVVHRDECQSVVAAAELLHPICCEICCLLQLGTGAEHNSPHLPRCGCCDVELGLYPCELDALVSSWSLSERAELDSFVEALHERIENDGLGYMANTSASKVNLNVHFTAVSSYAATVSSIQPKQIIYKATRDIAAGDEIFAPYNNNESKLF